VHLKVLGPIIQNGNTAALEVEVSGTHRGQLVSPGGDIPAINRRMSFHGARVLTFTPEGKIQSCNQYYDPAGILTQLGLMTENADAGV